MWFHVGMRGVPLSCSGKGGSALADWAVFTLVSDVMIM